MTGCGLSAGSAIPDHRDRAGAFQCCRSAAVDNYRQVDDLSRRLDGVERLKGGDDNSSLLFSVSGVAERMTEGAADEDGSGRSDLLRVLSDYGDANGCNPCLFNHSLDQSHGLIADASGWREEHQIDILLGQSLGDLKRGAFR